MASERFSFASYQEPILQLTDSDSDSSDIPNEQRNSRSSESIFKRWDNVIAKFRVVRGSKHKYIENYHARDDADTQQLLIRTNRNSRSFLFHSKKTDVY